METKLEEVDEIFGFGKDDVQEEFSLEFNLIL